MKVKVVGVVNFLLIFFGVVNFALYLCSVIIKQKYSLLKN